MAGIVENLLIVFLYVTAFVAALVVGGVFSDYIIPHIKPLERWLESLPAGKEDDDDDM